MDAEQSLDPTPTGSNGRSRPAKFPRQSPLMYSERVGHDRERCSLPVLCGRHGNRLVGHLADHAPPRDAGLVEVVDDRGPVDAVPTGESIDRGTLAVPVDQLFDLALGEPALHRV